MGSETSSFVTEIIIPSARESWKNKFEFVVISNDNDIHKRRYRKGFDSFKHLWRAMDQLYYQICISYWRALHQLLISSGSPL